MEAATWTMNRICIRACAKINLFLDVCQKNTDGYHAVNTVMLSHSLQDIITLERTESGISLVCDENRLPSDNDNIAYRAARLFFDKTGNEAGVSISLEKHIPFEAGMGGGSADAAAVIRGLNILCGNPLDMAEESVLAASLGADVPFFLRGGCCRMSGRGDVFEEKLPVPGCAMLIVKPEAGVSTSLAYKELDRLNEDFRTYTPADYGKLLSVLEHYDFGKFCGNIFNIFDSVLQELCPENLEILSAMRCLTPAAVLCGSGSAICGFFKTEKIALNAEKKMNSRFSGIRTFVCVPTESALIVD